MASELSYSLPELGSPNSAADPLIRTALSEIKNVYNAEVPPVQHPLKWYEPKIIPAEQTTTSATFTTLATPDEITGVVVPTNGLLLVAYYASFKSSVANQGSANLYVGNEPVKYKGAALGGSGTNNTFATLLSTSVSGLFSTEPATITAGPEYIAAGPKEGGFAVIRVPAGATTVSVRYKATSGSVSAVSRSLYVGVMGT